MKQHEQNCWPKRLNNGEKTRKKARRFVYPFELKKDSFPDEISRKRAIKQIETLLKKRFSDAALELCEERIAVSFALENMLL